MPHRGTSFAGCLVLALSMASSMTCVVAQECPALPELRERFIVHSSFDQAIETEQMALELLRTAPETCRPILEGHRWLSYTRAADFGFNVAAKYQRFKRGTAMLDSLVLAHPTEDGLRAMRLSIQGMAPAFIADDTHFTEDAEAIIRVSTTDFWAESPKFSEWMVNLAQDILDRQKK